MTGSGQRFCCMPYFRKGKQDWQVIGGFQGSMQSKATHCVGLENKYGPCNLKWLIMIINNENIELLT